MKNDFVNNLDKSITKLRNSPLFYLFSVSRELFHSNFWFWLFTINPTETARLFTKKRFAGSDLNFRREESIGNTNCKSKVDIAIYTSSKLKFIIENKVKDFASVDQLDRIIESCNDDSVNYILATLFWAPGIKFQGWRVLKYRDISNRLMPSKFTSNLYYKKLISDYKFFIGNLATLAESLPISTNYDFALSCQKPLYNNLDKIKLWESYQRMRASHLVNHYKMRFPSSEAQAKVTINNQKATIDFLLPLRREYAICVQIENRELRKMVRGDNAESFAANLLKKRLFFNEDYLSAQKKPLLKYDTTARYQIYDQLDCNLSFDKLFSKINKILRLVVKDKKFIENAVPR